MLVNPTLSRFTLHDIMVALRNIILLCNLSYVNIDYFFYNFGKKLK